MAIADDEIFQAHVSGKLSVALDAGARRITEKMMVAAAEAIFSVVSDDLAVDRIVPSPLDARGEAVAAAVAIASDDCV